MRNTSTIKEVNTNEKREKQKDNSDETKKMKVHMKKFCTIRFGVSSFSHTLHVSKIGSERITLSV